MKVNTFEYPKSALLGMQKDAILILDRITSSQNVLKLLYYNKRDWQNQPPVNEDMKNEMFATKQISCVPKLEIDREEKTYLRLTYGTMVPNASNPQYRDNSFGIDIICHYNIWELSRFDLRPYRIAGEIDSLLDKTHLTGIGQLEFVSCAPCVYDNEFAGVTLTYFAVRGNEDKVNPYE